MPLWVHIRVPVLVSFLSLVVITDGGGVCQIQTESGQSLQDAFGISCNVTDQHCNCSSSLLDGASWYVITEERNETMNDTAGPGEWYITDASGQCVASIGESSPVVLKPVPCPPGFYCSGGLSPPRSCDGGDHCPGGTREQDRRCPFGSFCPLPAAPLQRCPDGGYCPSGSSMPKACPPGYYCRDGDMKLCPGGHSCSVGAQEPRRCRLFSLCPPGSKNENFLAVTSVCLVVLGLVCWCVGKFYYRLVEHGIGPVVLCAAAVGLMWIIDHVIAGFLSLVFIAIAANWALLQLPIFPSVVSPFLIICTALCSLVALWALNPPWAMFEGGLFVPAILWWLMSREKFSCVVAGRMLLLVALGILIFAYIKVDPDFMVLVGALLLVIVLILIISWVWEQRRQHRQRASLPFFTRWRGASWRGISMAEGDHHENSPEATENTDVGLSWRVRDAEAGTAPLWRHTEPRQFESKAMAGNAPACNAEQASKASKLLRSREPSRRLGVSFRLKGVSFDLPDGSRLLQDISLAIGRGQRVAVMGPSGSGKSTLLAVLSGRASYGRVSGTLLVAGQPADDLRFLQKVTGFVPQDDVLHGELTAEDNIRFQAALRLPAGTTHEEIEDQIGRVAKDLNLEGIMKARVGTPEFRGVSGGQRKRISIGMELVARPLLLFADEPTSGLDSTTSHEVVNSLNSAAERLGTTVIAVIHQPRYETLRLFDCLVLLGVGGCLVYSGNTDKAVDHFKTVLQVDFPPNTNPADILLDAIQPPLGTSEEAARCWASRPSVQDEQMDGDEEASRAAFKRERVPFFRAVLIYMDRSMLQTIGAASSLLISQVLNIMAVGLLCTILTYETMDQWLMQSAFAVLFLMLLQGVAAQRIFGCDLLITWREARVGMPMVAYFMAKDLAAMVEVTISSVVFTAAYGSLSGMQLTLQKLFAGSWAFIYSVYGLSYISSITLSQGAAQMFAVVISFVAFCVSGVYQPQLNEITLYFNERGWMVPALSPIRWLWGYLLTNEAQYLTEATRLISEEPLRYKGYDLAYIDCPLDKRHKILTLCAAWKSNRAWVCSVAQMLLLGVMFRFLAVLCLTFRINAQTSGWGRFFGQSGAGAWKFTGNLFTLLVGTFLGLFLFAEVWVFGILKIDFGELW